MGGGRVTRPDFGLEQPDPGHPMTEFYTLLLEGLAGTERFTLPGLYAKFDPPAWPIEAREARDWCSLSPGPHPGGQPSQLRGAAAASLSLAFGRGSPALARLHHGAHPCSGA